MRRMLPMLLCVAVLLSVGGVYATWTYAELSPQPAEQAIGVSLSVFDYPPEEILPGGDQNDDPVELGQDHFVLIDLILNERQKGYGLNYSNNVVLHRYLEDNRVVYSNQKVSGGNLKFILDPKNNTHGLYYCVEKISDTEYYAYTFSDDALATAAGSSAEITAYRTTLVKTDKWNATTSYLGYAKVKRLSELGESADPNTIAYSIDVSTWHM